MSNDTQYVIQQWYSHNRYTSTTYYYYWYSALGPVWAETRAQSGDRYGSGTLHPGQVLRGSFALKNPMASAGFEPMNLGTKGQHATPRPPKPLLVQQLIKNEKTSPYATYSSDDN